jgi:mycothiol S-conjugate amidase
VLREFRPQVVVTYDENGGYPHPDHIRTHEVTLHAVDAAADATAFPEHGEPWSVSKLYYERIFNPRRIGAVRDALAAREPEHPKLTRLAEISEWFKDRPDLVTTRVPIADFLELRDAALRSHASQVPPDDEFFFWPNDLLREAWPYEDFQLVRSSVAAADDEDDLFAGIRDEDDE